MPRSRECDRPLLAKYQTVDEIRRGMWPNPDWWDYTALPNQIKGF
jgi:hypothetical protein